MNDTTIGLLTNIGCIALGSITSLLSSIIIFNYQFKKEKSEWIAKQKLDFYIKLIAILDSIDIQLIAEDIDTVTIDSECLNNHLIKLSDFINEHAGEQALYLSAKECTDIIKLRSQIYKIISNERHQKFNDFNELYHDVILKIFKSSKSIVNELKSDIIN